MASECFSATWVAEESALWGLVSRAWAPQNPGLPWACHLLLVWFWGEECPVHLQAPSRTALILRPQLPAQATGVLAASWAVGLHPAGLPTHIARRTRGDTQLLRKHSAPGSASGPDGGTVVTPVLAEDLPLPPWCAKPYLCGADRCPALGGTQHYESTCQVKRVLCLQGPPALRWELASELLADLRGQPSSATLEEQPHGEPGLSSSQCLPGSLSSSLGPG